MLMMLLEVVLGTYGQSLHQRALLGRYAGKQAADLPPGEHQLWFARGDALRLLGEDRMNELEGRPTTITAIKEKLHLGELSLGTVERFRYDPRTFAIWGRVMEEYGDQLLTAVNAGRRDLGPTWVGTSLPRVAADDEERRRRLRVAIAKTLRTAFFMPWADAAVIADAWLDGYRLTFNDRALEIIRMHEVEGCLAKLAVVTNIDPADPDHTCPGTLVAKVRARRKEAAEQRQARPEAKPAAAKAAKPAASPRNGSARPHWYRRKTVAG